VQTALDEVGWRVNIIEAAGLQPPSSPPEAEAVGVAFRKALQKLVCRTLVIDEAHLIFSFPVIVF
jgi:hypothetical protein